MPDPLERDWEYLDVLGVAERIGVKRDSVNEYHRTGRMPEPDLVWLGVRLWLVETIDAWRAQKSMRRDRRPVLPKMVVPRPKGGVPQLAKQAKKRSGAEIPKGHNARPSRRKSSSVGALRKPAISSVSDQRAREVAAALRAEGHYCTTADVMVLADSDPETLEHERRVLRERIMQRLA